MSHMAFYRESHPTPFVVTHWINLVGMIILIFTGCLIHYPFIAGLMGVARGAHVFTGFVVVINCIVRIVLAFFVKSSVAAGTRQTVLDYKTWLPQADNKHQGVPWTLYYFFLKKTRPLSAKYDVPQKITYLSIPFQILICFFTGLCLWTPTMDLGLCASFTTAVGGLMTVRLIHYFMMYLIIIFLLLHVYLATIEGPAHLGLMLFRKEHGGLVYDPQSHTVVGEDNLEYSD